MGTTYEGMLKADGLKFALVVSRFNSFITDRLVEGAVDCLVRHGADQANIDIVRVPGAFELPQAASRVAASDRYDGIITLGAVIRGSTPHFDFVANEAAKGIAQVAMSSRAAVVFGVLTTDTIEQAVERAGTKAGNKGAEAALSAIEMASLYQRLGR